MRGRVDVEIGLVRLGQEFLVAHRILKCLAQNRQPLRRNTWRTGRADAQQLGVEVETQAPCGHLRS
jgi:hypothetical protein